MAKHTPGPWHIGKSFRPNGYRDNPVIPIHATDAGCESCGHSSGTWLVGWTFKHATGNWKADARLIAAAPELLEALREIVAISDRKHDAWDRAKAAIEKATASREDPSDSA